MEIIKRGDLPEQRIYQATCRNCQTIFKFEKVEAKYCSDQRDGDYLEIQCPVCHKDCLVNVKSYEQK